MRAATSRRGLTAAEQPYVPCIAAGDAAGITGELRALVDEHPLRETLRSRLMLALYRSGQQAAAMEEFTRARKYLAGELGRIALSRRLGPCSQCAAGLLHRLAFAPRP